MESIRCIREFLIFSIILCISFISCNQNNSNQKIDNLVAFSKLYGYVRYFHPSDEAANTDWDAFVVNGVERVKNARNNEELSKILKQLFYPIAPTIQIYNNEENPKIPFVPQDTTDLVKVFWQHYGMEDNDVSNVYKSIRMNRNVENSNNSFWCYSELNDDEFQNCEIQFDLRLNTEFLNNESFIEIGLKGKNFQDETSDTVFANGITDASVKLSVEKPASPLYIGFQFVGQGKVIVDDAKLTIRKGNISKNIYLSNSGFEEYNSSREPKGWKVFGNFYDYKANITNPISGKSSFEIISQNNNIRGAIFDSFPKENEYFDKELIAGLKCRVPLVLWIDSTKSDNMNDTTNGLPQNQVFNLNNENTRLADVIITWNIIQHFFPYFEYLKVDWAEQQKKSLELTFKDENVVNIKKILVKMLEPLKDGHVEVFSEEDTNIGVLPFSADWVENQAIITKTADSTFKRGDIITKVNEIPIIDFIKKREKFISGSPQLKRKYCLSLGNFVEGKEGDSINLLIEREGKLKRKDVELLSIDTIQKLQHDNLKPIRKLVDGIYYINIGIVSIPDIEQNLDELIKAYGLIIDLREYPLDHEVSFFSYFSNTTIVTPSWFVPNTIYPDREKSKFSFTNRNIAPNQIFLKCKKIFIFDGGTISLGEEFASLVKYNKLGITIGQPTAGTNGEIIKYNLPGNLSFMFTGMKVLNSDSSQHYIVGVQPDIFVNKTIKGVKEGKDEYIDKAIELLME